MVMTATGPSRGSSNSCVDFDLVQSPAMRLKLKSAKFLLLIAILSTLASAEPISKLHASNYVSDFAAVLSPQTATQLNDVCRQIDEKAGAQIAVVTINSLDGSDVESYANTLYRTWGVGNKKTNKGVLVLLAVSDHRYRTEVGYGLEPILPDGKVGGFGREAVPFLRQSDYNGAVSLMVTRVATVIAQDAGVELSNVPRVAPPSTATDSPDVGTVAIVVFVILGGGLYLFYRVRKIGRA